MEYIVGREPGPRALTRTTPARMTAKNSRQTPHQLHGGQKRELVQVDVDEAHGDSRELESNS